MQSHHETRASDARVVISLSRSVSASRHAPVAEMIGAVKMYRPDRFAAGAGDECHALRGIDLRIERGATVGVFGPSGCGKSTLARCLAGLETLDAGRLLIDGKDVASRSTDARSGDLRQIQVVAQESTGERLRLAISRALALRPKLLILDESLSALDLETRALVISVLLTRQREDGLALLCLSRDLELLATFAPEIAVMQRGAIVEQGVVIRRYIPEPTMSA